MAPHSKRSSASDLVCEANTKHNVWIRRCAAGSAPAVSPIVHARSAQVGIGERESRRGWGQQLVVRGQLHSPMVKLVMRVAHVAPIRARCFNSKRTSFHVALELEHVESVDLRSAIRKADAVLPAFARAGQRGDTLKRVAWRGRCRLLFRLGVQHILSFFVCFRTSIPTQMSFKAKKQKTKRVCHSWTVYVRYTDGRL